MLSSSLGRSLSVLPPGHFCFSPHARTDLSLNPLGAAIYQATSSVFFSIAQTTSGPTREAIDRLVNKKVFSYGISDKHGGLTVKKPDGSFGIVDFNYLADITPIPFKESGGSGVHEHHKFVVTDFSLPTTKVSTGSSNPSPPIFPYLWAPRMRVTALDRSGTQ